MYLHLSVQFLKQRICIIIFCLLFYVCIYTKRIDIISSPIKLIQSLYWNWYVFGGFYYRPVSLREGKLCRFGPMTSMRVWSIEWWWTQSGKGSPLHFSYTHHPTLWLSPWRSWQVSKTLLNIGHTAGANL